MTYSLALVLLSVSVFMYTTVMQSMEKLTTQQMAKMSSGMAENPSSHCQPSVGMTISASSTSKHAPIAQNT